MTDRCVTAYRRQSAWYLTQNAQTVDGPWIAADLVVLGEEATASEIGGTVRCLLDASRVGVPHPSLEAMQKLTGPLVKASSSKSYAAFVRGTMSVDILERDGLVTFTPMRNAGMRGGFQFLKDRQLVVPATAGPQGLGDALIEALALAD